MIVAGSVFSPRQRSVWQALRWRGRKTEGKKSGSGEGAIVKF